MQRHHMTAVCVAGMHRSGTSMIARALHAGGVDLGPPGCLKAPAPDNREGFWEHEGFVELNDRLLRVMGGAWDFPPPADAVIPDHERHTIETRARELIGQFKTDLWGWKDPRNSLTLSFWGEILPALRVLVVVRHPLEVAASLHRRNLSSSALALTLWCEYQARIVAHTTPQQRVVSHYDTWFDDTGGEIRRVFGALGIRVDDDDVERITEAVVPDARRNKVRQQDAELPPEATALYELLCDEAQVPFPDGHRPPAAPRSRLTPGGPWSGARAVQEAIEARDEGRAVLIRELDTASARATDLEVDLASVSARLTAVEAESTHLRATVELLHDTLDAERASAARSADALTTSLAHVSTLIARPNMAAASVSSAGAPELTAPLERLTATVAEQAAEVAHLRRAIESSSAKSTEDAAYTEGVERFRRLVFDVVPRAATVAIASRGDESILAFDTCTGVHFPASESGAHRGYHPGDDLAAIAVVEVAHARGANALAFPPTEQWWLDHYVELRRHLERHHRLLGEDPHAGSVWLLGAGPTTANESVGTIGAHAAALERSTGVTPGVLDWSSGLALVDRLPDWGAFEPPDAGADRLPFLDATVDLVVTSAGDVGRASDARRVARTAVALVEPGGALSWEWLAAPPTDLPSTSIIIPAFDGAAMTAMCVRSVLATLDPEIDVEILVIDDASNDRTDLALAPMAESDTRVRIVRNDENLGFVAACNRGASEARCDVLVFLNNDTIALPGWLTPLVRTVACDPTVGVAGGKLLYPDGSLQEAGGVIFDDGRGANFGKGDAAPGAPLYSYVRDVDYCSGALLAVKQSVFQAVGGLDERFRPAYYEDTDLCFSIREAGLRVVFQPESVVVHLEGMSSGTDETTGVKRHQVVNRERFTEKWRARLADQPAHPGRFDDDTWFVLSIGRSR